jgi:hypothetical protein
MGRQKALRLENDEIVRVIEKAVSCGATGFTFSTDSTNFRILRSLAVSDKIDSHFAIYPVLPYAARYVRDINEKGIRGLVSDVFSQLSVGEKTKLIVQGSISTVMLNPLGAMMAYIDSELSKIPRTINIQSILLHEVVTDLAVSFRSVEVFETFINHVRSKWHVKPGFVTRNFPSFVDLFREMNQPLKEIVIMTPFNSIGFQMNPSRQSCEDCLSDMNGANVIAMSILAGGYIPLHKAPIYIRNLSNLSGAAIGVSSVDHAERTFRTMQELLADGSNRNSHSCNM